MRKDILGFDYFEERFESPSVIEESRRANRIVAQAGFYTGIIKEGNVENQVFKVQLMHGPTIKAVAIVDNPQNSLLLKLRPGDRVAVLYLPGVGGIILRKIMPPLSDEFLREDVSTMLKEGHQILLRNGVFLKLLEDESAEVALGNAFGVLKVLSGEAYFSHNNLLTLTGGSIELGIGNVRRADGIAEDLEEFHVLRDGLEIYFSPQYVATTASWRVPELDPLMGRLLGKIKVKDTSYELFEQGVRFHQESYFIVEFPQNRKILASPHSSGVSIKTSLGVKEVKIDLSQGATDVTINVEYNGKKLNLVISDVPNITTDSTKPELITTNITVAADNGAEIRLGDKIVLGGGEIANPVAYKGGKVSIPFGPVVGTSPIDVQRNLIGLQNMVNLMKFTTTTGPVMVNQPVDLSAIIVDGSGKVVTNSS